ncbi:hypothetical protein IJT93_08665 [bacterium]|nr:hypothetical protein [bacterium]
MLDPEILRRRYFVEYITWKTLEVNPPRFRYVQEPVFSLSIYEEHIIEFLHLHGLKFNLQPRYTPDIFINMEVSLKNRSQRVKLDCTSSLQSICTFTTSRTPFAEDFKGWLDRNLGVERFDKSKYTATRHRVSYSYALPLYESLSTAVQPHTPLIFPDSRHASYLFNFSSKESEFLRLLEESVNTPDETSPLQFLVYPRITETGSIELVIDNLQKRQPVRIFASGSHPVTYQVISENTELIPALKAYLDKALGPESLDLKNSRLKGRMVSLIYSHRSPSSIEYLFEDD